MTQIEKITKELTIRGISQKDFCDAINIASNTFSTWKSRGGNVPRRNLVAICNYFGWPVSEFAEYQAEYEKARTIERLCEESFAKANPMKCNSLEPEPNPIMSDTEDESYFLFKALPESDKLEIMQIIMKRAREYISGMRDE